MPAWRSIPRFDETRIEHRVIDGRPADVYEAIRYTDAVRKRRPHRLLPGMAAIGRSRIVRGAAVYGAALAFYLPAIRPRLLQWGASDDEARREAPGDQAVAEPHTTTTRAVTIRARPDQIWPWLAQMGSGRAGLYSYDWLDRLFGFISLPSSDVILPQFQNVAVGEVIPLGRGPSWPVIIAERDRALVVEPVAGQVSWAGLLYVVDTDTTRLISRVRVRIGRKPMLLAFAPVVDLPWFLMERKMLHGIRRRAESLARAATPARDVHR